MKTRLVDFLKLAIIAFFVVLNLSILGIFALFVYFSQQLPQLSSLEEYKPPLETEIFSWDGVLIGTFSEEKRRLVSLDELPPHVINAFLASEDSEFFEHSGVNFIAIIRAAITNVMAGRVVQGGSTITQQVAKSLLLTPERKFSRKIKELIIAWRMEKNLSKRDVLYLYLNNIYLGYHSYGIEAAAENYFGKRAKDLSVAESALLAGLPKAPSEYSPNRNPLRAKERQIYVLNRMREDGYITKEAFDKISKEVIQIRPLENINFKYAPHFLELVRMRLSELFPDEDLKTNGWRVITTLDFEMQQAADRAVEAGLLELDHRRGYRGPKENIPKSAWADYWAKRTAALLADAQRDRPVLMPLDHYRAPETVRLEQQKRYAEELVEEMLSVGEPGRAKQHPIIEGIVSYVDDAAGTATVDVFNKKAMLKFSETRWARRVDADESAEGAVISKMSQAVRIGDRISIRVLSNDSGGIHAELFQEPKAESALLSADVASSQIRAMVGGSIYTKDFFNRAMQARRQPGSAFKPLTYAAALDHGFTPASVIVDSPITFVNDEDNEKWRPKNYDAEFLGDTLFSTSLMKSRNVTTIKILNDIGVDAVIDLAHRSGISSPLERDFTLALGSSGISLWELMHPYYVFASGGYLPRFHYIMAIYDRSGKLIRRMTEFIPEMALDEAVASFQWVKTGYFRKQLQENLDWVNRRWVKNEPMGGFLQKNGSATPVADDTEPSEENEEPEVKKPGSEGVRKLAFTYTPIRPTQVISSQTAYVMTHLLSEVIQFGTGYRARDLNRQAAGKTGTTDDNVDAWFLGYTPNLLSGVWVGFNDLTTLGKLETGARAALPIWIDYMQNALSDYPIATFPVPDGIEFAKIDVKTGLLATESSSSAYEEAFKSGTAPKEYFSKETKAPSYQQFFNEEY